MTDGSEWFWGDLGTEDDREAIMATYDRVLRFPDGTRVAMKYDRPARVAVLHIFLSENVRHGKNVARVIALAIDTARQDGMAKVTAPLIEGNPHLRPNRQVKFGFTLEAVLRRHCFVAGQIRDLYLYSLFL